MNVVIVEDEAPARERLRSFLEEFPGGIRILAQLGSVSECENWFQQHPVPDLVFLDIQLSDGDSFQLLKNKIIRSPVIFITAYDSYILEALQHQSIDYILKPLKKDKLFKALQKYGEIKRFFESNMTKFFASVESVKTNRERVIARKRNHSVLIHVNDISYFFTEHKVVFLISKEGERFVVDDNLSILEAELPNTLFFRVNRKYLVHIDAIVRFRPHIRGRIQVDLLHHPSEEVLISQENARNFRNWINR